jgi:hypothetical protein
MKGAIMNRSLFVPALLLAASLSAPAYSMTATVSSTTQPAAAPGTSDAAKSGTAATSSVTSNAATSAASKAAMPSAASVTRPAAVLAAPGVPPKAAAAPVRAGTSRSGPILPAAAPQAVAYPPNNAAWAATSDSGSGMHRGTLESFNSAGTFQVYGQKLSFDPQKVKVFSAAGKPASIFSLKKGANVRYTLDSTDMRHRRVAVIYVN